MLRRLVLSGIDILRNPGLHRDAFFLAISTMVSGVGSIIYWKIITYRFTADMIGLTSAAITSATSLGGFSTLGLSAALVRFLPKLDPAHKSGLIQISSWFTLATSLVF